MSTAARPLRAGGPKTSWLVVGLATSYTVLALFSFANGDENKLGTDALGPRLLACQSGFHRVASSMESLGPLVFWRSSSFWSQQFIGQNGMVRFLQNHCSACGSVETSPSPRIASNHKRESCTISTAAGLRSILPTRSTRRLSLCTLRNPHLASLIRTISG